MNKVAPGTMENTTKGKRRITTFRCRDGGFKTAGVTAREAIKLWCSECCGWETHPKDCGVPICPLYQFRGKTQMSNKSEGVERWTI